jgi:MHS family shikimate/dehydroshikimate transporter-like MFS transporter
VLVIAALWIRNGMEESAEFEKQQENRPSKKAAGHGGTRPASWRFSENYCPAPVNC